MFVTHDSVTLKWLHHRGTVAAYEVCERESEGERQGGRSEGEGEGERE